MGALYAFPRIDPKVCPIHNDESSSSTCCSRKTADRPGHRLQLAVARPLPGGHPPRVDDLEQAILRIGSFLKGYQQ